VTTVLETIKIVSTPGVLGSKPRVEGRRVSVQHVAMLHEKLGRGVHEIAEELNLSLSEIYAALSYYHSHREVIEEDIRREKEYVEESPNVIHVDVDELVEGDLKLVMTPQEIAEEFGITPDAVYQTVRRGAIPHRRSGGTILIRRWDAERQWRNRNRRGRPRQPR
jgi:excisionase family DNA binding protein